MRIIVLVDTQLGEVLFPCQEARVPGIHCGYCGVLINATMSLYVLNLEGTMFWVPGHSGVAGNEKHIKWPVLLFI